MCSFPEGFQALSCQFADGAAEHVPLDPSRPEFSGDNSKLQFPWQPILTFRNFENAILRLPLPTVIVCKTATRASAVYAAYKVSQQLYNILLCFILQAAVCIFCRE